MTNLDRVRHALDRIDWYSLVYKIWFYRYLNNGTSSKGLYVMYKTKGIVAHDRVLMNDVRGEP